MTMPVAIDIKSLNLFLSTFNCIVSRPKNRTAHANQRAAFLDGDGVVVAHAHG